MAQEVRTGTILVKEDAVLPKELQFESEPCVPGWRLVKDFDGYGLDREIQKTGWTFFCLAGEIKATVFGIDGQNVVRRAIERILVSPKSEEFNSLEITRVASVGSERFPLVCYTTVSAQSRHIQESLFLCRAVRQPHAVPCRRIRPEKKERESSSQSTGIASGKTLLLQEPTKQSSVVSILSQ